MGQRLEPRRPNGHVGADGQRLEFSTEPKSITALNMRLNPDWGGAATPAASRSAVPGSV